MEFLERKNLSLLQRLRAVRKDYCCLHIDKQIGLWCDNQFNTQTIPQPDSQRLSDASTATTITTTTATTTATATTTTAATATTAATTAATTTAASSATPTPNATADNNDSYSINTDSYSSKPSEEGDEKTIGGFLSNIKHSEESEEKTIGCFLSDIKHSEESEEKTIGCFLSNIKHLDSFDSDATETSSDDSDNELEGFSHEDIPPKRRASYPHTAGPIESADLRKKAIWKWANERCRLASRWTWLQAQVADLEFRIRGQNDATMHAKAFKTPPLPPVLPENSCSRTVPISKDFRRRRLVKSSQILSDSNKKLVKFSHVPCICSSLPQSVAPCLSCNGRYNYLKRLEGENAPISERVSLLDPCCHPVLSLPDDLTLGSQLCYLLKQETINRKPTKGRPGRKKGSTAANLAAAAAAAAANGERNGKGKKGKYYHGMVGRPPGSQAGLKNPSQTMLASNKLRRKYRKHSYPNNFNSNNWVETNDHNHTTRRIKRMRRASSMNDSSNCSESSNQYRLNHFSNNSAQNVTRRRRSEQSAYDIDNIVIPFSIANTTRVTVLQYKEIMTPSWRVIEDEACQNEAIEDGIEDGACQKEAIEDEIEDTSDEVYMLRHSKGESEEKKRFSIPNISGSGRAGGANGAMVASIGPQARLSKRPPAGETAPASMDGPILSMDAKNGSGP